MPIKVTCKCGKVTNVPDAYAGRTGKCPACKQPVRVPTFEEIVAGNGAAPATAAAPKAMAVAHASPSAPPKPASRPTPVTAPVAASVPNAEQAYSAEEDSAEANVADRHDSPAALETSDYAGATHATGDDDGAKGQAAREAAPVSVAVPEKLRRPNNPPLYLQISTEGVETKPGFDATPILQAFVEALAARVGKKFDLRLESPAETGADPMVSVRVVQCKPGSRALRYLFPYIATLMKGNTCFAVEGSVQLPSQEPAPFGLRRRRHTSFLFGGSSQGLLKKNARGVAKKIAALVPSAK